MKSRIALIAAMTLVAGSAVAADSGFYAGAGIGYGKLNVDSDKIDNSIDSALFDTGFAVTKSSVGQGATPYSLTVGYKWMKYLATEVSYIDLGNATYNARISDGEDTLGTVKGQWDVKGWPVSVLGIWPIDDTWQVFGRVGVFIGDVKLTARAVDGGGTTILRGHADDSSTEFIGGVGVDYNFMETWVARLEWQAIPDLGSGETGSGNWNNINFALFYKF
jgi:opacity protein-like surface antigen